MSKFHGKQGRGAMKRLREQKRWAAEARAMDVRPERTRQHRLKLGM